MLPCCPPRGSVEASTLMPEQPPETNFYDSADSFASAPLLGRAYRMYATNPDFKALEDCSASGEGASIVVLPDRSGRLVISQRSGSTTNIGSALRSSVPRTEQGAPQGIPQVAPQGAPQGFPRKPCIFT